MFNVSGFLNARASSWLSCARFKRNPQRVAGVTLVVTSYPQAMALRTRPRKTVPYANCECLRD